MRSVLILGNGISRLLHEDMIANWFGEIWGCNRIFTEMPERLTRLSGHRDVLKEAAVYRDLNEYGYEIWAGHLGAAAEGWKLFTCPTQFRKDTGSTLLAQALEEQVDRIVICGFDFGGLDIHTPDLEKHNKSGWVRHWRALAEYYTLDTVQFVGYDHKPYILSDEDSEKYARKYRRGHPHILTEEYEELFYRFKGQPRPTPISEERNMEDKIKVIWPNGYVAEYNKPLADIFLKRGEVKRYLDPVVVEPDDIPLKTPVAKEVVAPKKKRGRPRGKRKKPEEIIATRGRTG